MKKVKNLVRPSASFAYIKYIMGSYPFWWQVNLKKFLPFI